MAIERVVVSQEIASPLDDVFLWFYHSENFIASPIVFRSSWRGESRWTKGAQRDIIMIAGWYAEEITSVRVNQSICYKVNRSFPSIRQDFTELTFEETENGRTRVTWTIEIEVPILVGQRVVNRLAGRMARILYTTILTAGKRSLEEV